METVCGEELISDEQWDNDVRSDIDLVKSRDRLSKETVRRCNEDSIKESRLREVTIRNCNLTKIETKAERLADLKSYADRRPKVPTGKITEELIKQHAKEASQKLEENKKIKHQRIADDMSVVSSLHSNVSRVLRVCMPTKPKKTIVPAPPQPPT